MRRLCLFLGLALFASTVFAQTTALPQQRQKLGGTEPTQRIAREVMHELLMQTSYTVFDNLAFRVEGNTVYLYGQAVSLGLKSDAESAVKHIEGVEKVVNNIEALPPSGEDARIRRATYRAIFGFGGLNRYAWGAVPSIHIIVKHGHVTLVGVVDNPTDKQMAEMRAKGVSGVFSVDDQLQVAGGGRK